MEVAIFMGRKTSICPHPPPSFTHKPPRITHLPARPQGRFASPPCQLSLTSPLPCPIRNHQPAAHCSLLTPHYSTSLAPLSDSQPPCGGSLLPPPSSLDPPARSPARLATINRRLTPHSSLLTILPACSHARFATINRRLITYHLSFISYPLTYKPIPLPDSQSPYGGHCSFFIPHF
jgi:hypothetical protein